MKKLKKNQKGFTLVEIIVVLVILAILAAAAVPTMLGYVDDAKKKTELANARTSFVAAQSIVTEKFAMATGTNTVRDTAAKGAITDAEVARLTGLTATEFDVVTGATDLVVTDGKVIKFTYRGATHTTVIEPPKEPVITANTVSPT